MVSAERPARILVVDDDPTIVDVLVGYIRRADMAVDSAGDGFAALAAVAAAGRRGEPYDAVVLDLMLPGIDGLEVCRRLRAAGVDVPVIMLTARGEEEDRVAGLEVGADDYVAKPFSPRELVLRLRAVLRRTTKVGDDRPGGPLRDGDLELDVAARTVTLAGRSLALTTREFDLLAFLVARPGRAFTRQDLMSQVWQWEFGDLSTVTVHVRRLRGKVEADAAQPIRLVTVWGVGYRWDAQPMVSAGSSPMSGAEQIR